MAIAAEYKIGQTTIVIHDDYCREQAKEDVEVILNNISRIASRQIREEAYRKGLEMQKAI